MRHHRSPHVAKHHAIGRISPAAGNNLIDNRCSSEFHNHRLFITTLQNHGLIRIIAFQPRCLDNFNCTFPRLQFRLNILVRLEYVFFECTFSHACRHDCTGTLHQQCGIVNPRGILIVVVNNHKRRQLPKKI